MKDNSNYQDIVSYIETLHASRHLIAQSYCEGSIDILDENLRKLRELQQIRVMRNNVNRDESLRLSKPMMDMLDHAVHRFRSLAVATNFTDSVNHLFSLAEGYLKAGIESRFDEQEVYSSDFDLAAYGISEEIHGMLMRVDTLAHNHFANVTSYSEKMIQNEHYLKQMKKLVEALSLLRDPSLMDVLESSLDLQALYIVYSRHILDNMTKWRAKLLDIIGYLERYMSKMRSVEPHARRIRMLSMHFHRFPEYAPKDVEDYPSIPEWAYRHEGFTVKAHPDIESEHNLEAYIQAAKSIERTDSILKTVRSEGMYIEVEEEEQFVELQLTPFEAMVVKFVELASSASTDSPLSAKAFFEDHQDDLPVDTRISLICLAATLSNPEKATMFGLDTVQVTRTEEPIEDGFQGNIYLTDFIACQAA